MKYIAWDIEIAAQVGSEQNWKKHRPLGITCGATLTSDGIMMAWHPVQMSDGHYGGRMTPTDVREMVTHLAKMHSFGYVPLTWNGLGFDFDITSEECRDESYEALCAKLAWDHYDLGFQMVCEMGYMIALKKAAEGLKVEGKTAGMSGALAPLLWGGGLDTEETRALGVVPGSAEAQSLVLEYVCQDVRATANVAEALIEQRLVYWTTQRGTRAYNPWMPTLEKEANGDPRFLRVCEAVNLSKPDTSWMTRPKSRESYYDWARVYLAADGVLVI